MDRRGLQEQLNAAKAIKQLFIEAHEHKKIIYRPQLELEMLTRFPISPLSIRRIIDAAIKIYARQEGQNIIPNSMTNEAT